MRSFHFLLACLLLAGPRMALARPAPPHVPPAWRMLPPDDVENVRAALEAGLDPHHPFVEFLRHTGRFDPANDGEAETAVSASRTGTLSSPAMGPDALVNDRLPPCTACKDLPAGQVEPSIAVHGEHVVVAFNNYGNVCNQSSREDYAYSSDGGASFTDAQGFPNAEQGGTVYGDPAVAVNRATGIFYLSGLYGGGLLGTGGGVAAAKAHFSGPSLVIDRVTQTVVNPDVQNHFFDRPFMTVDSLSGNVYFTWADFGTINDAIEFQACDSLLDPIGPIVTLAPEDPNTGYQDAQPAVGPDGEVYVVWWESNLSTDSIAVRKSVDHGVTFGPRQLVSARFVSNIYNGAPGMLRTFGVVVPSIVVDGTPGPHRGRVYVAWEGALNFRAAPFDSEPPVVETEPNDALSNASDFAPGAVLRGVRADLADKDYWRFTGSAGQTFAAIASFDSTREDIYVKLHHFAAAADSSTDRVIAFTGMTSNGIVFTLPSDGVYFLELGANRSNTPSTYVIHTAFVTPGPEDIALDHRDPLLSWSDDGETWSTPVRLADDAPRYDSVYPSLAVDGQGRVHCFWLDYREDPVYGNLCRAYVTSSADGGASWGPNRPLADAASLWPTAMCLNNGNSLGDYMQMSADGDRVLAAFTDARFGDSDILADVTVSAEERACLDSVTVGAQRDTVIDFSVVNAGNYERTLHWSLSDDRGWITAVTPSASGSLDLAPGQPLLVSATVMPASCASDSATISFVVSDPFLPGDTTRCSTVVRCRETSTPALASLMSVESAPDHVTLIWYGVDLGEGGRVYRRDASHESMLLGEVVFDASDRARFTDRSVTSGARYAYRLGWSGLQGEILGPEAWIDVPSGYALAFEAPVPNPSPSPRLAFVLSRAGPVKLDLYGGSGRHVRTLESGVREAGRHELTWDGSDNSRRALPSGIYFARFEAEGHVLRRMVLLLR